MGEVSAAYAGCRTRIGDLTRALGDTQAAVGVPACPGWSVHDLVVHLAGLVDDAMNGRLDGVATDPWTAAQVSARRDVAIADMLAAWDSMAPAFEDMLDNIGRSGRQVVADAVTHEHDLRGALDTPGFRDSDAVRIGFDFVANGFVAAGAANGLSIAVHTDEGDSYGDGAAGAVVNGNTFDLLRAMTGRRSEDQLRALDWQGDVEGIVAAFTYGPFHPAEVTITE